MIKLTLAGKFLTLNSFPKLKRGLERRKENNKINLRINYAITKGLLTSNQNNEINIIDLFRWAISAGKGGELYWPWLGECINLPLEPIRAGGSLITTSQIVLPVDVKECQTMLIDSINKAAETQKQLNALLKKNEELETTRLKRIDGGKKGGK
ncbi:MAG: hypothetical protein QNK15_07870 [Cycloclasticus sp.]|nr:hypothetical protein [Cycloclasticus sp.]